MRGVRPLRPGDPPSVGSYKVTGFLGEGGQGSVYLGVSPGGEQVAIKLLHARFADDEHAVRRFRREAESARRVAEFCTARVLEVGAVNDQPYIVGEYVDGPSLQHQVTKEGPVRGPALLRLAITTATALVAIHGAGVVHRDFKPSNVLLGPDGPRVIDFGIARALDASQSLTTSIVGTPAFMAPEQFLGEALPASDVFAWAGTMVFAATGRAAFGLGPLPVVMHRILNLDPDLSGLPGELAPLLWASLAKDHRFRPTAEQLIRDLIRAGTAPPPASARVDAVPPPRPGPISTPPPGPASTPPSGPVSTPPSGPVSAPPSAPIPTPPSGPVSAPQPASGPQQQAGGRAEAPAAGDAGSMHTPQLRNGTPPAWAAPGGGPQADAPVRHEQASPSGSSPQPHAQTPRSAAQTPRPHAQGARQTPSSWPMSPQQLGVAIEPTGGRRRRNVLMAAGAAATTLVIGAVVWFVAQAGLPSTPTTSPMPTPTSATGFGAAVAAVVNPSSKTGGTVRAVSASSLESTDPGNMYLPDSLNLIRLYGRSLTMFRAMPAPGGTQVVPDLAESLGVPSDGARTWTYKLRQGLKYQDGTPITSHDVKHAVLRSMDSGFSNGSSHFDLMLDLPTGYQGAYKSSGSNTGSAIETPDDRTIVFHLRKPYSTFDHVVQLPETVPVPAAKDTRQSYGKRFLASGPYQLESVTDQKVTLTRNPRWDAATDPNRKPLPDRYEIEYNVESDVAEQRLYDGEAEFGLPVARLKAGTVLGDPALKERADATATGIVSMLAINPQVAPFDNLECRRAVVRALDLNDLRRAYGTDVAGIQAPTSLLPPVIPGRRHLDPDLKGDQQTAKASLTACRKASGFAATYLHRDSPMEMAAAEMVQAQLAEVGISVTLRAASVVDFFQKYAGNPEYLKENDIGLIAKGWAADWPDPDSFLASIADSRTIIPQASTNVSVRVKAIDDLMDQARAELDATTRAGLWERVEQRLAEEAVLVPLSWQGQVLVRGKNATNVHVNPIYGNYDLLTMGVS